MQSYAPPPPPKDPYYGNEELYEDENEELSEEQKQEQAQRCLKIFNGTLMLLSGGLCGFAYYTGEGSYGGAWTAFAAAGVGGTVFIITLLGLLGAVRLNRKILLFYYTCLIFSAMALLVLGGFCFILTEEAVRYVKENWDKIVREMSQEERNSMSEEDVADKIRFNLRIVGGVSVMLFLMLLSVMSSVVRLISKLKAYQIVLQSTNIAVMPFGVALIAGGLYIADTAASVDAPYAAFAVFILGVAVILIASVGCLGSSIESRGIIKLFMILIFVQTWGVLAIGITAFVAAERVKETVAENWDSIRRVLPPDFSGAYDKEQFMAFVEANLQAMGFLAICNGLLLVTQFVASMRLRRALKAEAEDDPFGGPEDPIDLAKIERPNRLKVLWKQKWTNGSKKSRAIIKCTCACLCLLVLLVLVGACLVLYFSTSCASISDFQEDYDFPEAGSVDAFTLRNTYKRGSTTVTVDPDASSMALGFTKGAFRASFADANTPSSSVDGDTNTLAVTASGGEPKLLLGFDISCQTGTFAFTSPAAAHYGGNTLAASRATPAIDVDTDSALASVDLNLGTTALAERPRFRRVDTRTTVGPIDIVGMLVGAEGMRAVSENGEIAVAGTDVVCDPKFMGLMDRSGVTLGTQQGGVTVEGTSFFDCLVDVTGDASFLRVANSTVASQYGGASLNMNGVKGVVEVERAIADSMDLKGEEGSIRVRDAVVRDILKAATQYGSVEITGLTVAMGASVQIETIEGKIEVHLQQFAGIVSVLSGGQISCSGEGFDRECVAQSEEGTELAQADTTINCAAQGDCPYRGELIITSELGSVEIVADLWDRSTSSSS